MSIFNTYKKIEYSINDFDKIKAIDITTSIKLKNILKQYSSILFVPYVVSDGERPDQVSNTLYGSPYYDWIILLTNDIYSIYDDWPKSSQVLERYIIKKYGSIGNAENIVRYYNKYGDAINFYEYNLMTAAEKNLSKIENAYEYELRLNINKSKIKVLRPGSITQVESDLRSIIDLSIE